MPQKKEHPIEEQKPATTQEDSPEKEKNEDDLDLDDIETGAEKVLQRWNQRGQQGGQ